MRIEEYHRGDVFFADLGSLDLGELYYHRQEPGLSWWFRTMSAASIRRRSPAIWVMRSPGASKRREGPSFSHRLQILFATQMLSVKRKSN